jgi:hypothetical protein
MRRKQEIHSAEAATAINSLHVSWIYFNQEMRRKYHLAKRFAFYHADTNIDYIIRVEKEFKKLELKDSEDYLIQENDFGDWHIYTMCLSDKASKRLENMGVHITDTVH